MIARDRPRVGIACRLMLTSDPITEEHRSHSASLARSGWYYARAEDLNDRFNSSPAACDHLT